MNTANTPTQDTTKRYANAVSNTRGGCYASPKLDVQGVPLHLPCTKARASIILGFRTMLNYRLVAR